MTEFEKKLDVKVLDKILKDTVVALERGRESIFDIASMAKAEVARVKEELDRVCYEVQEAVETVDELESKFRKARIRLMEVSRDFYKYGEATMEECYKAAEELRVQLATWRERESALRARRDELQRSLKSLEAITQRADTLFDNVSLAAKLLTEGLDKFNEHLEGLQQKHQLGVMIIQAQEEERRRVAREIHDGPAQALANVVLRAEIAEKLLAADPARGLAEFSEVKAMVKDSLSEMRRIMFNLRPMALDDLGLVPTLRQYIEELRRRSGLNIGFSVIGHERRLNGSLEIALFRVVQEALLNVLKHSQATQAAVSLEFTSDAVMVCIRDNGKGFVLEEVEKAAEGKEHFGLLTMRERVELFNGTLKIQTAPERGTRVFLRVPLENLEAQEDEGTA